MRLPPKSLSAGCFWFLKSLASGRNLPNLGPNMILQKKSHTKPSWIQPSVAPPFQNPRVYRWLSSVVARESEKCQSSPKGHPRLSWWKPWNGTNKNPCFWRKARVNFPWIFLGEAKCVGKGRTDTVAARKDCEERIGFGSSDDSN